MDTTTPGSELIFHVMEALAQFERSLIVERTRAACRPRGSGAPGLAGSQN
jgi:DNA invertase Pin-like site-specific DNA recombinase